MESKSLVEVLLPLPFDRAFSYFVPENVEIEIGDVVKVPFSNRQIYGVVTKISSNQDLDLSKIKTILEKEPDLKFSAKLLEFIKWVSNYNLAKTGAVLKLSISILNSAKKPKKPKVKTSAQPILTENFKLKSLSSDQQIAVKFLSEKISDQKHSVTLIDGITGSGKTEIYFAAIAEILQKTSGQILILLPEIVLTTQLIQRFYDQFGFKPPIWHSKITLAKKRDIFMNLANGKIRVLIGARSALFLPFQNLSLIVVDEEHEASFKQEEVLNYHGRDMAIVRAKIEEIPIILSSATPSLESYINAKNGKYHHLILEKKFSDHQHIPVNLVDMRKEKLEKSHHLSAILISELIKNFHDQKQSLLFLNRRGYAPLTLCKACGHKVNCPNCSSYVTYHQRLHLLICHHCGYNVKTLEDCPSCHAEKSLINFGVGVEKIKEEVLKYLPEARTTLITSDIIAHPNDAEKIISEILDHKIDIIIGTQMIAKGHHFPALSLVGIVDGDGSFYNGDLRNAERSYQLLTQVIGRAGRDKYQGQVILQSYNPENLVFKTIINGSKDQFMEVEIKNRQLMNMPPFSKLTALIFIAPQENDAINSAKMILREFPSQENIRIFGPAPMPISKIRSKYYYRLMIKSDKKINIQKLIGQILSQIKLPNSVRIRIDVDPI